MATQVPNRVSAGVSAGGQFTPKANSEADIDLVADSGPELRFESMQELADAYMDSVRSNPTRDGLLETRKAFRSEVLRMEAERYSVPDQWTANVYTHDTDNPDFSFNQRVLDDRSLLIINSMRGAELAAKYKHYTDVKELDVIVVDKYGEHAARSIELSRSIPRDEMTTSIKKHGVWWRTYTQSLDSVHDGIEGGDGSYIPKGGMQSAIKSAYGSGNSGYRMQRIDDEFSEVTVIPSSNDRRIHDSIENETPSVLTDGWL